MSNTPRKNRGDFSSLRFGASVVALGMMAAGMAGSAVAQDAAATSNTATADKSADKSTEVVVVGVRRSLKTSQQIKKDADTIVDSITATDIGAFPDKSVAEALQRVAGITVSRFAATSDTAHFSAEPSGVIVRGLSQVRSEFNGRDTFSANSSRGLSWGDVSPELMGGVDSYKNETADMIEGGIAGSIDLRTRLPFDSKGQVIAVSVDASYNENGHKTTPDLSGIYTNRWDTSIGEFGLMLNGAASDVQTRSEGIQESRDGVFAPSVFGTKGNAYIPTSIALHNNDYTRNRTGIAAAAQWQNHDHSMLATLQFNSTSYDDSWKENIVSGNFFGTWQDPVTDVFTDPTIVAPATGTSAFTFAPNGMFLTGTPSSHYFGSTGSGLGMGPNGQPQIAGCNSWTPITPGGANGTEASCGRLASGVTDSTRYADTKEKTQDLSFNFKWDVTDRLKTNFDVQYVNSTVTNYDMTADISSFQNVAVDLSGKYPKMTVSAPENVNLYPGGLSNPNNFRYNDLMDHAEDSAGHEIASRLDAQYRIGDGWLNTLKVGVRYADREQTVRWSNYNWAGLSSVWSSGASATTDWSITGKDYPQDVYGVHGVSNSMWKLASPQVFINMDSIKDRADFAAQLNANKVGFGWTPLCMRSTDISGSCYGEAEVNHVAEKTWAAYAELKFGGKDKVIFNGISVEGNAGVRWVQTQDVSTGFVQAPANTWVSNLFTETSYCGSSASAPLDQQLACFLPDPGFTNTADGYHRAASPAHFTTATNLLAADAFSNGAGSQLVSDKVHINILPSLNVKFNLTDQWILRFAASEAMSRPDMGYLKNYVSINQPSIDAVSPICVTEGACIQSNGKNVDFNPVFTASAGNAALKSTTADQFDVSLEDYFASVGSFSFDLFYKKFHNYITTGKYLETFQNNGVSETVVVTGPINGDGASVKGFEVAYQRFFDFLPGLWSGLGVQANYTHIVNTGVSNANLTNVSGSGSATPTSSASGLGEDVDSINPHALEGLSPDSYNVILMYEKGPWAARLAYNWRSQYLVSGLDCCVGLPIWQKQQGLLDGSIRYKINDNIEVSLEGTNILGSDTVLMQQVAGDTNATPNAPRVLMPDAWFRNDRRFQVGVRLKY